MKKNWLCGLPLQLDCQEQACKRKTKSMKTRPGDSVVRASDLWSRGREFHCQIA